MIPSAEDFKCISDMMDDKGVPVANRRVRFLNEHGELVELHIDKHGRVTEYVEREEKK